MSDTSDQYSPKGTLGRDALKELADAFVANPAFGYNKSSSFQVGDFNVQPIREDLWAVTADGNRKFFLKSMGFAEKNRGLPHRIEAGVLEGDYGVRMQLQRLLGFGGYAFVVAEDKNEVLWIVMDAVEGTPLDHYLGIFNSDLAMEAEDEAWSWGALTDFASQLGRLAAASLLVSNVRSQEGDPFFHDGGDWIYHSDTGSLTGIQLEEPIGLTHDRDHGIAQGARNMLGALTLLVRASRRQLGINPEGENAQELLSAFLQGWKTEFADIHFQSEAILDLLSQMPENEILIDRFYNAYAVDAEEQWLKALSELLQTQQLWGEEEKFLDAARDRLTDELAAEWIDEALRPLHEYKPELLRGKTITARGANDAPFVSVNIEGKIIILNYDTLPSSGDTAVAAMVAFELGDFDSAVELFDLDAYTRRGREVKNYSEALVLALALAAQIRQITGIDFDLYIMGATARRDPRTVEDVDYFVAKPGDYYSVEPEADALFSQTLRRLLHTEPHRNQPKLIQTMERYRPGDIRHFQLHSGTIEELPFDAATASSDAPQPFELEVSGTVNAEGSMEEARKNLLADLAEPMQSLGRGGEGFLLLLQHLVDNAVEAVFLSGTRGQVDIALREKGESLVIEVEDTGTGIAEEIFGEYMFDAGESTKGDRWLGGIGLTEVLAAVEAVGYEYIEVETRRAGESAQGFRMTAHGAEEFESQRQERGTTFRIRIPMTEGEVISTSSEEPYPIAFQPVAEGVDVESRWRTVSETASSLKNFLERQGEVVKAIYALGSFLSSEVPSVLDYLVVLEGNEEHAPNWRWDLDHLAAAIAGSQERIPIDLQTVGEQWLLDSSHHQARLTRNRVQSLMRHVLGKAYELPPAHDYFLLEVALELNRDAEDYIADGDAKKAKRRLVLAEQLLAGVSDEEASIEVIEALEATGIVRYQDEQLTRISRFRSVLRNQPENTLSEDERSLPELSRDVLQGFDEYAPEADVDNPLVVVGASRGGYAAIRAFLNGLTQPHPPVVIVEHLTQEGGDSASSLAEDFPEVIVMGPTPTDGLREQPLLPNTVLLAHGNLRVQVGRDEAGSLLAVVGKEAEHGEIGQPVNAFFERAARNFGPNVFAVVLSGSGHSGAQSTDGAAGALAVAEAGGRVFIQHPAEAEKEAMPATAVETLKAAGHQVLELNVAEIGSRIVSELQAQSEARTAAANEKPLSSAVSTALGWLRAYDPLLLGGREVREAITPDQETLDVRVQAQSVILSYADSSPPSAVDAFVAVAQALGLDVPSTINNLVASSLINEEVHRSLVFALHTELADGAGRELFDAISGSEIERQALDILSTNVEWSLRAVHGLVQALILPDTTAEFAELVTRYKDVEGIDRLFGDIKPGSSISAKRALQGRVYELLALKDAMEEGLIDEPLAMTVVIKEGNETKGEWDILGRRSHEGVFIEVKVVDVVGAAGLANLRMEFGDRTAPELKRAWAARLVERGVDRTRALVARQEELTANQQDSLPKFLMNIGFESLDRIIFMLAHNGGPAFEEIIMQEVAAAKERHPALNIDVVGFEPNSSEAIISHLRETQIQKDIADEAKRLLRRQEEAYQKAKRFVERRVRKVAAVTTENEEASTVEHIHRQDVIAILRDAYPEFGGALKRLLDSPAIDWRVEPASRFLEAYPMDVLQVILQVYPTHIGEFYQASDAGLAAMQRAIEEAARQRLNKKSISEPIVDLVLQEMHQRAINNYGDLDPREAFIRQFATDGAGWVLRRAKELKPKIAYSVDYADAVRDAMRQLEKYFSRQLIEDEKAQHLVGRVAQFDPVAAATAFGIGYCSAECDLSDAMQGIEDSSQILKLIGIITAEGEPVIGNALIIPLHDKEGGTVGFIARYLPLEDSETPIQKKYSQVVLPGYDPTYLLFPSAPEDISFETLILTESAKGTIAARLSGIDNVFATSGATLGGAQIDLLSDWRETHGLRRVVLAFDGDEAGREGAEKARTRLEAIGFDVAAAELPDGEDLESLLSKEGPEALQARLRADEVGASETEYGAAAVDMTNRTRPLHALSQLAAHLQQRARVLRPEQHAEAYRSNRLHEALGLEPEDLPEGTKPQNDIVEALREAVRELTEGQWAFRRLLSAGYQRSGVDSLVLEVERTEEGETAGERRVLRFFGAEREDEARAQAEHYIRLRAEDAAFAEGTLDVEIEEDAPYYLVEHVEGRTLLEWVDRELTASQESVLHPEQLQVIGRNHMQTLQAAFRAGLVFWDSKLGNVVVPETELGDEALHGVFIDLDFGHTVFPEDMREAVAYDTGERVRVDRSLAQRNLVHMLNQLRKAVIGGLIRQAFDGDRDAFVAAARSTPEPELYLNERLTSEQIERFYSTGFGGLRVAASEGGDDSGSGGATQGRASGMQADEAEAVLDGGSSAVPDETAVLEYFEVWTGPSPNGKRVPVRVIRLSGEAIRTLDLDSEQFPWMTNHLALHDGNLRYKDLIALLDNDSNIIAVTVIEDRNFERTRWVNMTEVAMRNRSGVSSRAYWYLSEALTLLTLLDMPAGWSWKAAAASGSGAGLLAAIGAEEEESALWVMAPRQIEAARQRYRATGRLAPPEFERGPANGSESTAAMATKVPLPVINLPAGERLPTASTAVLPPVINFNGAGQSKVAGQPAISGRVSVPRPRNNMLSLEEQLTALAEIIAASGRSLPSPELLEELLHGKPRVTPQTDTTLSPESRREQRTAMLETVRRLMQLSTNGNVDSAGDRRAYVAWIRSKEKPSLIDEDYTVYPVPGNEELYLVVTREGGSALGIELLEAGVLRFDANWFAREGSNFVAKLRAANLIAVTRQEVTDIVAEAMGAGNDVEDQEAAWMLARELLRQKISESRKETARVRRDTGGVPERDSGGPSASSAAVIETQSADPANRGDEKSHLLRFEEWLGGRTPIESPGGLLEALLEMRTGSAPVQDRVISRIPSDTNGRLRLALLGDEGLQTPGYLNALKDLGRAALIGGWLAWHLTFAAHESGEKFSPRSINDVLHRYMPRLLMAVLRTGAVVLWPVRALVKALLKSKRVPGGWVLVLSATVLTVLFGVQTVAAVQGLIEGLAQMAAVLQRSPLTPYLLAAEAFMVVVRVLKRLQGASEGGLSIKVWEAYERKADDWIRLRTLRDHAERIVDREERENRRAEARVDAAIKRAEKELERLMEESSKLEQEALEDGKKITELREALRQRADEMAESIKKRESKVLEFEAAVTNLKQKMEALQVEVDETIRVQAAEASQMLDSMKLELQGLKKREALLGELSKAVSLHEGALQQIEGVRGEVRQRAQMMNAKLRQIETRKSEIREVESLENLNRLSEKISAELGEASGMLVQLEQREEAVAEIKRQLDEAVDFAELVEQVEQARSAGRQHLLRMSQLLEQADGTIKQYKSWIGQAEGSAQAIEAESASAVRGIDAEIAGLGEDWEHYRADYRRMMRHVKPAVRRLLQAEYKVRALQRSVLDTAHDLELYLRAAQRGGNLDPQKVRREIEQTQKVIVEAARQAERDYAEAEAEYEALRRRVAAAHDGMVSAYERAKRTHQDTVRIYKGNDDTSIRSRLLQHQLHLNGAQESFRALIDEARAYERDTGRQMNEAVRRIREAKIEIDRLSQEVRHVVALQHEELAEVAEALKEALTTRAVSIHDIQKAHVNRAREAQRQTENQADRIPKTVVTEGVRPSMASSLAPEEELEQVPEAKAATQAPRRAGIDREAVDDDLRRQQAQNRARRREHMEAQTAEAVKQLSSPVSDRTRHTAPLNLGGIERAILDGTMTINGVRRAVAKAEEELEQERAIAREAEAEAKRIAEQQEKALKSEGYSDVRSHLVRPTPDIEEAKRRMKGKPEDAAAREQKAAMSALRGRLSDDGLPKEKRFAYYTEDDEGNRSLVVNTSHPNWNYVQLMQPQTEAEDEAMRSGLVDDVKAHQRLQEARARLTARLQGSGQEAPSSLLLGGSADRNVESAARAERLGAKGTGPRRPLEALLSSIRDEELERGLPESRVDKALADIAYAVERLGAESRAEYAVPTPPASEDNEVRQISLDVPEGAGTVDGGQKGAVVGALGLFVPVVLVLAGAALLGQPLLAVAAGLTGIIVLLAAQRVPSETEGQGAESDSEASEDGVTASQQPGGSPTETPEVRGGPATDAVSAEVLALQSS